MLLSFNYISGFVLLLLIKVDINILLWSTLYSYYKYYNQDILVIKKLATACYLGALVSSLVPLAFFFILKKPKRELYGHSRMATRHEAVKALPAPKGVLCGKLGKNYLSFGGTQHALMEAPSRSRKGVGFITPNYLIFHDSIAVLDIKGENYSITSEYRRKHDNEVYFFNPAPNGIYNEKTKKREYHTHRWNLLACISNDHNERVNDIQKIASQLFPDRDSNSGGNLFFQQ